MSRIRRAHRAHPARSVLAFVLPIAGVALAAIILVAVLAVEGVLGYGTDLPKLRKGDLPRADETTKIYSADGKLLANLYAEQNRVPLALAKIPPTVRKAVVDIEDERFWTHSGVDFRAVARAVQVNLRSGQVLEGGSTIEQQYVRTVLITREKTLRRKIREAMLAYQLKTILSKEEVLERYLNTVYFGQSAYGIEAAAVTYFGKHAARLKLPEVALLAGLIKSPNRLSPYSNPAEARRRRNVVLYKMYAQGHVNEQRLEAALNEPLRLKPPRPPDSRAPYFTEYVKQQLIDKYGADAVFRGGLRVTTSLDRRLQAGAEQAWRRVLGRRDDPAVAIVALDPRSGFIKAMVGGRNFTRAKFNLATQGHRQPGSAFKPFVLAAALESGMSPNTKIDSAPALIDLPGGGTWNVDNATEGSGGAPMALRDATVHSVNAVFARLVMNVGPEKVAATAADLGIRTPLGSNPAIALGGLRRGVTPLEMASAYGSFAGGGVWHAPTGVTKVRSVSGHLADSTEPVGLMAVSAGTAYLVTDILKGVIEEGTGTEADIGRPAAGKTGTTQSYRDAWFVGYVPTLVASVWVGYPQSERPMTNVRGIAVKGGTFPAAIWARFMRSALSRKPGTDFARPGGELAKVKVCTETGLRATRYCPETVMAQFARGAVPRTTCNVHGRRTAGGVLITPNLVGLTKATALTRIRSAGLTARVQSAYDGAKGIVQYQTPRAGTSMPRGGAVTIYVSLAGSAVSNDTPVARFSVSPSIASPGQVVTCDASSSWDPDGDIVSYRWTFGDGDGASGEVAGHSYARASTYTVTLSVFDSRGAVGSASRSVRIE